MRRREFIAMLCSGAAFWPADVHAQQHDKVRTIALVGDDGSVWRPWTTAFADRMRELGWIENRDVAFVYRWTEGRPEARRRGDRMNGPMSATGPFRRGCEGIVSKRLGTPYRVGRSANWLKTKNPASPPVRRLVEEDWGP